MQIYMFISSKHSRIQGLKEPLYMWQQLSSELFKYQTVTMQQNACSLAPNGQLDHQI